MGQLGSTHEGFWSLRPSNPPTLSNVTFMSTPSGSASAVAITCQYMYSIPNARLGLHDFGLIRPKFWTSVGALLPAPPAGIAEGPAPALPFIAGMRSSCLSVQWLITPIAWIGDGDVPSHLYLDHPWHGPGPSLWLTTVNPSLQLRLQQRHHRT